MKQAKAIKPDFIFETKHWEVYLNPDQYYLGRSVVVSKRDVGSMSGLKNEEWLDFAKLVKRLEHAGQKAFKAIMFNWCCLMNNAYQNNPPDPHVHWHFRPRYAKPVEFDGIKFSDIEFGHHYARGTDTIVSDKTFQKIIKELRENL